jgi:hypothetical protein
MEPEDVVVVVAPASTAVPRGERVLDPDDEVAALVSVAPDVIQ